MPTLPDTWLLLLEPLRRTRPQPTPLRLPAVTGDLRTALTALPARERFVLEHHWLKGWSLEATGSRLPKPVSRQRVEQIEKQALSTLLRNCPELGSRLQSWFHPDRPWIRLIQVEDDDVGFAEAIASLLEHLLDTRFKLTKLEAGLWSLVSPPEHAAIRQRLRTCLEGEGFLPRAFLEDQLGVEGPWLETVLACFQDELHVTEDHRCASRRQPLLTRMVALASELAQGGVLDFHCDELASALAFIDPEGSPGLTSHHVSSCLSGARASQRFSHTGRRGRWQLVEHGDGAPNNLQAVHAAYQQHRCALHWTDVHAHLVRDGRTVQPRTIYSLLFGSRSFESLGAGVFVPTGAPRVCRAIEQWLLDQLPPGTERPLDELLQKALQAGIEPLRIRGTAAAAESLVYQGRPPRISRRNPCPYP